MNRSLEELLRAEKVGLVLFPQELNGTKCGNCKFFKDNFCNNTNVMMSVNANTECCNLWDNDKATYEKPKKDIIEQYYSIKFLGSKDSTDEFINAFLKK